MKCVMHVDTENLEDIVDGHLIIIPPNEIFEVPEIRGTDCNNNGPYEYIIPDHQVMAKILDHKWYHGVVEVPMIKTKEGIHADMKAAKAKAAIALEEADKRVLNRYVTDQIERTTKEGKPAVSPGGRVLKVIEKRGIDLKKEFNIDPPGYTLNKVIDRDSELAELRGQVEKLMEALGDSRKK